MDAAASVRTRCAGVELQLADFIDDLVDDCAYDSVVRILPAPKNMETEGHVGHLCLEHTVMRKVRSRMVWISFSQTLDDEEGVINVTILVILTHCRREVVLNETLLRQTNGHIDLPCEPSPNCNSHGTCRNGKSTNSAFWCRRETKDWCRLNFDKQTFEMGVFLPIK